MQPVPDLAAIASPAASSAWASSVVSASTHRFRVIGGQIKATPQPTKKRGRKFPRDNAARAWEADEPLVARLGRRSFIPRPRTWRDSRHEFSRCRPSRCSSDLGSEQAERSADAARRTGAASRRLLSLPGESRSDLGSRPGRTPRNTANRDALSPRGNLPQRTTSPCVRGPTWRMLDGGFTPSATNGRGIFSVLYQPGRSRTIGRRLGPTSVQPPTCHQPI